MKFYKIIQDKNFIGIVSSNNFYRYNTKKRSFLLSNEIEGQFIDLNNKLYRDYWMREVPDYSIQYENADVIEISENEYNLIVEASKEPIPQFDDFMPEEEETIDLTPISNEVEVDIEYLKKIAIAKLSKDCNKVIEAGFDLDIRGETHHFSLTTQDQLNLMNINLMAQTQELIPYHADGEECTFYTPDEINQIVSAATQFKNYNIAYYNSLKIYINSLDNVEDITEITYGTPIPEEYKSDVLRVLE